jgi:hypothetical protein
VPPLIYHEVAECKSVCGIACEDCAETGVLEVLERSDNESDDSGARHWIALVVA